MLPDCPSTGKKLMLKCETILDEFHGLFQGVDIGMQDVIGK